MTPNMEVSQEAPANFHLKPTHSDCHRARFISDRAEAMVRLQRQMGEVPDLYTLESYPDDNADHRWIFRRNIIRHILNRFDFFRRLNQLWLMARLISAEEWEQTDHLHAEQFRQAVELIARLPSEQRKELAQISQTYNSQERAA